MRTRRIKVRIDYKGHKFSYFLQFKVMGFWFTCDILHLESKEDYKRHILTKWMDSLFIIQCGHIYYKNESE